MAAPKLAPFDAEGNLLEWTSTPVGSPLTFHTYVRGPEDRWVRVLVGTGEWRPMAETFRGVLVYDGWGRGRSAVRIYWRDGAGHRFPMFMTDMDALLEGGHVGHRVAPGVASTACAFGEWRVVKRGANYGVQRVGA